MSTTVATKFAIDGATLERRSPKCRTQQHQDKASVTQPHQERGKLNSANIQQLVFERHAAQRLKICESNHSAISEPNFTITWSYKRKKDKLRRFSIMTPRMDPRECVVWVPAGDACNAAIARNILKSCLSCSIQLWRCNTLEWSVAVGFE